MDAQKLGVTGYSALQQAGNLASFTRLGQSNIPAGGKLNPRFVCFWRSYSRHWMRNAWFWQTIQFMIFAVPLCFGFFRAFCNVFCIHELPKSASFFCSFFEICRFQHISARVFFYRQGQSSRLDSLIQDFGSLLKQAGSSVLPSPLPDKLLDEDLTTYQARLTSYWTKILQRIRNA